VIDPADQIRRTATRGWQRRAKCSTVDPEIFFPLPSDRRGIASAERVCIGCPVIVSCRIAGREQPYGTWGGRFRDPNYRFGELSTDYQRKLYNAYLGAKKTDQDITPGSFFDANDLPLYEAYKKWRNRRGPNSNPTPKQTGKRQGKSNV
jgi:hypothetical protein